jgi:dTDP-4-dehydrorhamnose 3,5-epimerase
VIIEPIEIAGAYLIDPERFEDERGFFARTWCPREFEKHGLNPRLAQCSISFNKAPWTLRGMHRQVAPHEEAKVVRCTRGAIFDVVLDLRTSSPTYLQWRGIELTAENRRMLYIPEGCAHGFQTLESDSEVLYQISEFHHPESARGVRWDDPTFGIRWPSQPSVVSERDRTYPLFQETTS